MNAITSLVGDMEGLKSGSIRFAKMGAGAAVGFGLAKYIGDMLTTPSGKNADGTDNTTKPTILASVGADGKTYDPTGKPTAMGYVLPLAKIVLGAISARLLARFSYEAAMGFGAGMAAQGVAGLVVAISGGKAKVDETVDGKKKNLLGKLGVTSLSGLGSDVVMFNGAFPAMKPTSIEQLQGAYPAARPTSVQQLNGLGANRFPSVLTAGM